MHPDSEKLARYICEHSKHAQVGGETFDTAALCTALNMTKDNLDLAVNELESEGLVRAHRSMGGGHYVLMAEAALFRELDPDVKGWNAEDDALEVAREIVKKQGGSATPDVAKILGWPPRRMNPACEELYALDDKCARKYMGPSPFTYGNLMPTDSIRRLARDGW